MTIIAPHHRAAHRRAAPPPAPTSPTSVYKIVVGTHFRPDMHGEFAGQRVALRSGHPTVALTASQARYYLDQGAIELWPDAPAAARSTVKPSLVMGPPVPNRNPPVELGP